MEAKTELSINYICSFLNEYHFVELTTLECKTKISRITFYEIGYDTFSSKPFLKYSLVIFDDLNLKIWHGDESLSLETVGNIVNGRKISLFDQITEILEYLKVLCSQPHLDISKEVNVCVQKLKNLKDNVNLNIRSKLLLIVEQLQLAFMNMKHCRYFPDLLPISVFWKNASSTLYKQIRDEGLWTIPSTRCIKKLISALSVKTALSDNTTKYLEARCQKLHFREKIGSLIFDEIYTASQSFPLLIQH